jgi:hypothetical protein
VLLCWLVPKGYLEESMFSASLKPGEVYVPDVSIRIVPKLTSDAEYLLAVESCRSSTRSQCDVTESILYNTDSLRGAIIGTTLGLLANSDAMRIMILFVRSILVWFICHWGKLI